MSDKLYLESVGMTDTGLVRKNNEDSFLCDDQNAFWAVADGMGGHDAGEVASDIAVTRTHALLSNCEKPIDAPTIQGAVNTVNMEIYNYGIENHLANGLGTTLTGLLKTATDKYVALHIGDSRMYRVRDDEIETITTDHSWVQQQIDVGEITIDEARFHPMKNVIMRSLGYDISVEADLFTLDLKPGDRLLIASDGLTNKVTDNDILSAILRTDNPRAALQGLTQLALERGGEDNITSVLIRVVESE